MNIIFQQQLLYTSIEITYKGKSKSIKNIIIDTRAAHSIISPDSVEDIGITSQIEDKLITMYGIGGAQYAYRKKIDNINFGNFSLDEYEMDFGLIDDEGKINGLLGLDILMKIGAILDLKNLKIYSSE